MYKLFVVQQRAGMQCGDYSKKIQIIIQQICFGQLRLGVELCCYQDVIAVLRVEKKQLKIPLLI